MREVAFKDAYDIIPERAYFNYDESQHPRDERGRWTTGGEGGAHGPDADLVKGAAAIAAMPQDERDNTEPWNAPGGIAAWHLYEAQKLAPKDTGKLKKVNDRNTLSLYREQDYVANVGGRLFGVTKQEDPDAGDDNEDENGVPRQFVYAFQPLDSKSLDLHETQTADVNELFRIMRGEPSDAFIPKRGKFSYDESQHPRDERGRWTTGDGGGAGEDDVHELRGTGRGGGMTKDDVVRVAKEEGVRKLEVKPIATKEVRGQRYEVLGTHNPKTGVITINSKALGQLGEKELRGIVRHEQGHADLDRAWKSGGSGVKQYISKNFEKLRRDDGTTAYSRGFWRTYESHAREKAVDAIDRMMRDHASNHAIHESFAEMRRVGKFPGSYAKLNTLVEKHSGR